MIPTNFFDYIAKWEGGYANHKLDTGGETNRGITLTTFNSLASKLLGDNSYTRFLNLTFDDFKKFVNHYWNLANGNEFKDANVAAMLTDLTWGSGEGGAKKILRNALTAMNRTATTSTAITSDDVKIVNTILDQGKFFDELHKARLAFYNAIVARSPNQVVFLKGWTNRANDFYNTFKKKST